MKQFKYVCPEFLMKYLGHLSSRDQHHIYLMIHIFNEERKENTWISQMIVGCFCAGSWLINQGSGIWAWDFLQCCLPTAHIQHSSFTPALCLHHVLELVWIVNKFLMSTSTSPDFHWKHTFYFLLNIFLSWLSAPCPLEKKVKTTTEPLSNETVSNSSIFHSS